MPALSIYVTFWDTGFGEDGVEWMLTARSASPDRPTQTFSYAIVLVPGTNRWIEAHRTPGDPMSDATVYPKAGGKAGTLMGALLLANSDIIEHLSLEAFDTFIKESEEAIADNPVPERITDWGPELWTTARVAQLAMAEWIVLSPVAATEFDFEFHNYDRLRDRISARKVILQRQQIERGLQGWDNVLPLE